MLALLTFLKTPRALIAIAILAAVAALAAGFYVRGQTIRALEAEKEVLAAKLETTGALLADQNKAVETLREASDAQAQRAAKAAKKAERALGAANARAEALALTQVPVACPDALEWLRAEVSKSSKLPERSE